ncbi:MAG TPA: hypothetical protein VH092_24545, partial [Urbifossiella sp.]|nr:hypothetical protein [Urbifossiella sp.]
EGQVDDLGGNTIQVTDPDAQPGDNYEVVLQLGNPAATFVLLDPTAVPASVVISGAGTNTLTVDGDAAEVAGLFGPTGVLGFTTPTPYFSGLVPLTASITAFRMVPGPALILQPGDFGAAVSEIVQPVVSPAGVTAGNTQEVFAPSGAFALGAGFFTVQSWPDADGSETGRVVLSLGGLANAGGFTLAVNGTPLAAAGPGQWVLTGATAAALQAQLDALTLTPPAGFGGRVTLIATFTLVDSAPGIPTPYRAIDTATAQAATPLRFFTTGATIRPPLVTGSEGQPLALGGKLTPVDPNDLPGDLHTLTLAVPTGVLTANPIALPPTVTLTVVDPRTVVLAGPLPDIVAFLADTGSLTFDPQNPSFSGIVRLGYTLATQPAMPTRGDGPAPAYTPPPSSGVVTLALAPVASALTPVAPDVTTNRNVPVALTVSVPGLAGLDPTETSSIQLLGLPAGSSLNHGTAAGGGAWNLTAADLSGLAFTPPRGFVGVIPITILVTVTNTNADLGTSATAIGTATFTVTVRTTNSATPTPAPTPTPHPRDIPRDGDDDTDASDTSELPPPVTDAARDHPGDLTGAPGGARVDAGGHPTEGGPGGGGPGGGPQADRAHPDPAATLGVVFGGPGGGGPTGGPGPRPEAGAPAAGSLFSRAEPPVAPLPAVSARHPLPPVLPLDQSAPVAGFTDSGGDSLALIDAVYRDAVGVPAGPAETIPVVFAPDRPARSDDTAPAAQAAAAGPAPGGPTAWAAGAGGPTPDGGG